MDQEDKLRRFVRAMEAVYGPFEDMTQAEAEHWKPPEDPGAGGHRGRYLWTDAFGVVNFLTLHKETSSPKYLALAKRLVQTVHDVLGRTRDGVARLPNATDDEPLNGGLRIGKMSESGSDGDGQYHHYLTLWMFALNRLSLAAGDPKFNDLAIQLAKAIHRHFVFRRQSGGLRMVWKISMDMKDVLVASEGHLDSATGFVIYELLEETATQQGCGELLLYEEVKDYLQIMSMEGKLSPSGDLLDLGMSLWICDLCKKESWATSLGDKALDVAKRVLDEKSPTMRRSASYRLAFREFGACMGISCYGGDDYLESRVAALIGFWDNHMQQQQDDDLKPISHVMYAAALIVGAFRNGYLSSSRS